MTKNIGVWIDHKRAVIMILSDEDEKLKKIESGMEKRIHFRGDSTSKSPYSAQYQQGDDQLDRQYIEHLNIFYGKVIEELRGAESILIFGPGEAKFEFEKRIAHEKINVQIVGVETTDKMTDPQIAVKVRRFFEKLTT